MEVIGAQDFDIIGNRSVRVGAIVLGGVGWGWSLIVWHLSIKNLAYWN